MFEDITGKVKFDDKGLIAAISQDVDTGLVLMVGYMNEESLGLTLDTGLMTYWSRSRQELWVKGKGKSGHFQHVKEFRIDCDGDALLFQVEQVGGACHTGYRSCFYRLQQDGSFVEDGEKIFDPDSVH
ncbi:MAG: phosphoribosyl-AMP cyclohydrolase [Candidatus Latescibacteria bacterium]|jgi:phosphoribosyl-AMP cyclohydrolase|nr:phosphoribosyl-AMP cyclohydrolase [Candidatus Latescibacterota bacterium]